MARNVIRFRSARLPKVGAEAVLAALPSAVAVVDKDLTVLRLNSAAEQFFRGGAEHLRGQRLDRLVPADSPLIAVIEQARKEGHPVAEYRLRLASPRIGEHFVNIWASPLAELAGAVVVTLQERSIAAKIERQLNHRGAARSISALAAMLAHEVKNPIAGICGAAQLLEQGVAPEDRELTRLIRAEAERICALVDRMAVFSVDGPLQRQAVNIHEVLNRVCLLAAKGFARDVRLIERYDPSLPPVLGNRDQLTQVFLNLIKNAAEAVPPTGGEVVITTAYQHGVRFAIPGGNTQVHLPLIISICDNGTGIPEDIRPHLFEPFVTSKPKGSGLGLPLVAKIISDHGGVVEVDGRRGGTEVRVMLPTVRAGEKAGEGEC